MWCRHRRSETSTRRADTDQYTRLNVVPPSRPTARPRTPSSLCRSGRCLRRTSYIATKLPWRPGLWDSPGIQVERRRAKALRAMRDLVSREARLPRAALVSLPSFASTPRGVPVPTRSLPASLPPYRWTACAAPLPAYCCSVTLAAASPATRCSASAADGCSWPCVRSRRPGRRELASRCLSRCRARPRGLAS